MNGAATFTDTVFLNAQGNANAVFVIQINGALTTSTYSNVVLRNGAQSKNVYWKIEGAVSINNYSTFRGTIICNNGALGALNTGVTLDGRALATSGAITTTAMSATVPEVPSNCGSVSIESSDASNDIETVTIYPNPFSDILTIKIMSASILNKSDVRIYNILGEEVVNTIVTKQITTLETSTLPTGVYFYKVNINNKITQSGKLISK
jgi:hypothetical protein